MLQQDIFPHAKGFERYILVVLNHSRISDDEKTYIKNGTKSINETSYELFSKPFLKLTKTQREKLIKDISKLRWGRYYLDTALSYILESYLGDPIYGGNINQSGWREFNFKAGLPRPTKAYL